MSGKNKMNLRERRLNFMNSLSFLFKKNGKSLNFRSFLLKFKTTVVVGVVESIDRYHRLVFFFSHL